MKKRMLGLVLSIVMLSMTVLPVYATDEVTEITWGDNNTSTVSGQSTTPTISSQQTTTAVNTSKPYLALGADLSQEQLATVINLMGLSGQDLSNYKIVYITNQQEHSYLDAYVDPSVIGTKSLSSVLVREAEEGHGVQVTTQNINYCTVGMYRNALLTAGVKNADILVVGPTPISGTAGLIGALKAYEDMSGKAVTEASIDTALNELVTTGEIADAIGDPEEVSNMIAFIKAEIAGKDLDTREQIDAAVREAINDYGATLTEDEIKQIVDLMVKIKDLGLDYNTLLDQAQDLYNKFGDKLTLDDLTNLSGETKMDIIKVAVGQFFTNIFDKVSNFFSGLFQ
ncbi:MAG: DUF1002 domain-containing protein [Lachnospiraceae bacterium]|nr:DUF1002 domain-containing protein [Lachnospiraceae bacterium]